MNAFLLLLIFILLLNVFLNYIGYPQLDKFFKVLICIICVIIIYNFLTPSPSILDPYGLPEFN
jgi:Mn2+/Fe2+ NRAMP family transporter